MGAAAADRHLPAELAGADAVFGLAWCPPTALTGGGPPVRGGGDPGDGRLPRASCSARGSCRCNTSPDTVIARCATLHPPHTALWRPGRARRWRRQPIRERARPAQRPRIPDPQAPSDDLNKLPIRYVPIPGIDLEAERTDHPVRSAPFGLSMPTRAKLGRWPHGPAGDLLIAALSEQPRGCVGDALARAGLLELTQPEVGHVPMLSAGQAADHGCRESIQRLTRASILAPAGPVAPAIRGVACAGRAAAPTREQLRTAHQMPEENGHGGVRRTGRPRAAGHRRDRPHAHRPGRPHRRGQRGADRPGGAGRAAGPGRPVQPGDRCPAVHQRARSSTTCTRSSPSSESAPAASYTGSCPKTWTPSGQADPPASRRRGRRATRPPLATWAVQSSPPLATCTVRLVDASAALPA
jgi:hypothetical protein